LLVAFAGWLMARAERRRQLMRQVRWI